MRTTAAAVFSLALLLDCSSSKESGPGRVEGALFVIGNEPFTSLALEGEDRKMYRIEATEEVTMRLRSLQGRRVIVEFSRMKRGVEGPIIVVTEFRELPPEGR